jgi:hypothetical protein
VTQLPSSISTFNTLDLTGSDSMAPFRGARLIGCNLRAAVSDLDQAFCSWSLWNELKSKLVHHYQFMCNPFETQYYHKIGCADTLHNPLKHLFYCPVDCDECKGAVGRTIQ